jgi:creatinine amidohydrolase
MLLTEMTWTDVEAAIADDTMIIVPVGAIEQHGLHLPVSTDSLIAEAVALRVAERRRAIVAPTIHYTPHSRPAAGGGDKRFPGSVGIPGRVLEQMVEHLTKDLFRQGFRRVVYLNGHFENIAPITEALTEVSEQFEDHSSMLISWPDMITHQQSVELIPGFVGLRYEHAAVSEASCVVALRPELYRAEHAGKGGSVRDELYDVFPVPDELVPPSGMLGDASLTSAEVGEQLLELAVAGIVAALDRDLT